MRSGIDQLRQLRQFRQLRQCQSREQFSRCRVRVRVRVRQNVVVDEAEYIENSLEETVEEGEGVGRRKVSVRVRRRFGVGLASAAHQPVP